MDNGKLAITDRVTKFFPDAPPTWQDITVEHLLTHTSGIANYTAGKVDYRKDYTEDELVKLAYGLPLDFKPGDQWRYSNTGYVILGAIVRKVTGSFYGDVLRDRVFQPLGMSTAGFGAPGSANNVDQPWGHSDATGQRVPNKGDNTPALGPAGTVFQMASGSSRSGGASRWISGRRSAGSRRKPEAAR